MANYVYIATSLDGYIATKDGGIEWLHTLPNPEQSDYGYADFMEGIDALVMGRQTYEKVLSFDEWPYTKPVFVLSRTLKEVPAALEGKVEFVEGELRELVDGCRQRGYNHLYIDGGKVIQGFLEEDLIDELIVTRVPILLGSGIPLFGELSRQMTWKHVNTTVYNDMLVKSHYTRHQRKA
ncbi:MAG TPA: diacylglycerol kinase [Myxococcales bacterium]|nr:diacylglycerol kinase [Deltaproteobacteria bacterium]MBU50728.1 diacylglycerol kinase [Deltaproteobacteria bacterium]HAA57914.1 diacylglycerol kinase [Myxococcales bacterium]